LTFLVAAGTVLNGTVLTGTVLAGAVLAGAVLNGTVLNGTAAFGVFLWLEVLDFDLFLTFCWHLFSFRVGLYCVSGAEEQLPACNVLFWNQVIQTNHFFFLALWPLIS